MSCKNVVVFIQISKCLGKSFQHNGHGVDAKDLAQKMQQLSTEVGKSAQTMFIFKYLNFLQNKCLHDSKNDHLLYFQRADEGDAATPSSVSPADFFSQTPKENSNFQIPVSCGKARHLLTQLITRLTHISVSISFNNLFRFF